MSIAFAISGFRCTSNHFGYDTEGDAGLGPSAVSPQTERERERDRERDRERRRETERRRGRE